MPEHPDIAVYINALRERIKGQSLSNIRLKSAFVLRSVEPPLSAFREQTVTGISSLGKRIVLRFEEAPNGPLFLVIHLMIAGRLRWKKPGFKSTARQVLCLFDFKGGTLMLTEAAKKKRAKLHAVQGINELHTHDPGGLVILSASCQQFIEAMTRRNHTLKRALTDPRLVSGIGNAFSDEILHEAQLSPVQLTQQLTDEELKRLFEVARMTLETWTVRLEERRQGAFPEKVTAFRPGMAAHGKYQQPCPRCHAAIQRIKYANHETNYCPTCQTGGRLLADRALSRLLKKDWPTTPEDLEEMKRDHREHG